jgi:hypothetical protein
METNTLGELCAAFRAKRDQLDEIEAQAKAARKTCDELEGEIMRRLEASGAESISAAGITFTVKTKFRASYDPAEWSEIVRWAAGSGLDYIVQRRLNDAKILELVDKGVILPDGLTIQSYKDLTFRRS